ncbi:LysR substrate-binding domain-containing protein [Streptomyces sp. CBMA152]|uniref:LysR substrate-binding domain-containing protein n=1 Tax=Streptomyces sp. CBMA152 TaxID=1896312 RepID=UPI00166145A3|nr:LysR substrate-binding domain-containing protein [Streptomyces sp. CBMA152]MBD0742451.1 LysR family transcriptional regulator [Streptomyces sp. CBMA152]
MSDPSTSSAPGAPPVRFGIHGSPHLASAVVRAAGRDGSAVQMVGYDVEDPFRGLRAKELDVMIVKYGLREPDLALSRPVAYDPRAAIVGAHHPLATRASVSVEELADYDAFRCPGAFPAYVWDEVVPPRTPAGRTIRRRYDMGTVQGLMELLAGTDAVHISFQSLDTITPPHIKVVPIADLSPAPVALAWLRELEPGAHVRQFITDAENGSTAR